MALTDPVTITGNEEEGISLIDVGGNVTLTDVSLTGNTLNSFVGGATVFNLDTTTGNTVDHVEINTLALGGEDFLQHTRGGVVQDTIETANIGTLDIDFDAGDDTVTVAPHSTNNYRSQWWRSHSAPGGRRDLCDSNRRNGNTYYPWI